MSLYFAYAYVMLYVSQQSSRIIELIYNTVFGTNHHFSVDNIFIAYIGIVGVEVNAGTVIIPPSTLPLCSTVATAAIVIVVWSGKLHPIQWVICKQISMMTGSIIP